ncbi:MAG: response regulator [Lachnospiraceae bacterium]|nr:response regulator [Lachnospiraceae bacterium]
MELLKLLLVDDEKIILKGLEMTYDWERMGYEVIGTAGSGEEALALLEDEEPDVVITDVRMKKISGLELIERTKLLRPETKFVVVSAYKDFEYARKACEEGALSYLVKPIDDHELGQVMEKAYQTCMEERKQDQKLESFVKILSRDNINFLSQMLERYVKDVIAEEELWVLADELSESIGIHQYFCGVCVDIDVAYKVTNQIEFDAHRYRLFDIIEKKLKEKSAIWKYSGSDGSSIFIIKLGDTPDTSWIKEMLEQVKVKHERMIISAVSNAYVGLGGIKTAYKQAVKLFGIASEAGAGVLSISVGAKVPVNAQYFEELENQVIRVLRKNSMEQLKEVFEQLIYHLPEEEKTAKSYLHRLAARAEVVFDDSYGISDNIRLGFENFYSMMNQCTLLRMIDLLYKLLGAMIEERLLSVPPMAEAYFSDYIEQALTYVRGHLDDAELSITTVAEKVFLNPVYFGRLFKNVMGMSFKKFLLNERMERAKKMILNTQDSIAEIGGKVGILNPSYFSQQFKQITGKLPSEYKKEYYL